MGLNLIFSGSRLKKSLVILPTLQADGSPAKVGPEKIKYIAGK